MARIYNSQWTPGPIRSPFGGEIKFNLNWLKLIIPLVVVLWLLSGIYIVRPGEQAVVRRFGRAVRVTDEGPHYRLPRPLEKVDKVEVEKVRRLEIGFRTVSAGSPARYKFILKESLMLTGDEQMIDAQMTVQYQVSDPEDFLFNVRDLEAQQGALRDASEVALRQVVGERPIDDVLIGEKLQIEVDIRGLLQQIIDKYEAGVRIVAVKLQTVRPPKEVEKAFSDVVSAKEDKDRLVKEAEGYYQDLLPRARGQAQKMIEDAQAYKVERTNRASGDADRFLSILGEYENAKDVTRKRLYLETMEKILPGIRKFVVDASVGKNVLQILPLEEKGGK